MHAETPRSIVRALCLTDTTRTDISSQPTSDVDSAKGG